MNDATIGAIVLVGDHNWRRGTIWTSVMAFVLGRRERFEHLGMRCTVAWWREQPYLIGLREAPPAPGSGQFVPGRPTTPPPPKPKR